MILCQLAARMHVLVTEHVQMMRARVFPRLRERTAHGILATEIAQRMGQHAHPQRVGVYVPLVDGAPNVR